MEGDAEELRTLLEQMVVQILKKNKLAEQGAQPIYVEQNHRPQLLYTEEDRALVSEAWSMTAAHRSDLAGRQTQAVALPDRPNIIDLLHKEEG